MRRFLNFKLIKKFFLFILEYIYPHRCPTCKKIVENDKVFCSRCWKKLQFIQLPHCVKCNEPLEFNIDKNLLCSKCLNNKKIYYDKVISVFIYNKTISKAIFAFKFYRKIFLANFFVFFMKKRMKDFPNQIDYIALIPMHLKKMRQRGFNQSLLLAVELSKETKIPIIKNLLRKNKHTKNQISLKGKERKKNLKNAFIFNPDHKDLIKNKNILIIDDVFTTGTTINECAKILKDQKAKKVFALTIAKTSKRRIDKEFIFLDDKLDL